MHRRVLLLSFSVCWLILNASAPESATAQTPSCADFDAWVWAQTVYDNDRNGMGPWLDPDRNGVACDEIRGEWGFAPATWTDGIPASAFPAEITGVVDGDTLDVLIDGQPDRVRLYRADTPETYFEQQCGGAEATAFTSDVLRLNDEGSRIYLQQDATLRDPDNRLLAYVWLLVDGKPYLLNEVLIRDGMARDVDYGDHLYNQQLIDAATFAMNYRLGVYELCGGFPGQEPLPPPKNLPTSVADVPAPIPTVAPQSSNCDPSYPTVCIAPQWEVGDLDCKDVPYRRFQVLPPDPHGFDGDLNGVGCESYT